MSFYTTLSGCVKCPDKTTFDKLFNLLCTGGWLKQDQFQNESKQFVDVNAHFDSETFEFFIPEAYYRDLAQVNFFVNPATTGYIYGSSTDGCEICWVDGPSDVCSPEMPLWLFGDANKEPEDDFQRLNWLTKAEINFHTSSYDRIMATYHEYSDPNHPVSGQTDATI